MPGARRRQRRMLSQAIIWFPFGVAAAVMSARCQGGGRKISGWLAADAGGVGQILEVASVANRFDNVSLDDLLNRAEEVRLESEQLVAAIKERLLAECPVKIGCIYRFTAEALPWRRGKEFLVCGRRAENFAFFNSRPRYAVGIHGFNALKSSTAGDGFGIKAHVLRDWRLLDIGSERAGPRPDLVKYAAMIAEIEERTDA